MLGMRRVSSRDSREVSVARDLVPVYVCTDALVHLSDTVVNGVNFLCILCFHS